MIAIGIGANSKAQAHDFAATLASICGEIGGDVVATVENAPFIELLAEAASRRSMVCRAIPLVELRNRNSDCRTSSKRTLDLFGVASIAEASALAAAGPRSLLLVSRRIIGNITVAAAESADARESQK